MLKEYAWGAWGRRFKSFHPDKLTAKELNLGLTPFFFGVTLICRNQQNHAIIDKLSRLTASL